ncbi:hypothetical protein ACYOEI_26270, partial [Singulisphaera rosea]
MHQFGWLKSLRSVLAAGRVSSLGRTPGRLRGSQRTARRLATLESLEQRLVMSASAGDNRYFGAIATSGQINTYTFTLAAPTPVWFDSLTSSNRLTWSVSGPLGSSDTRTFDSGDAYLGLEPAGTYTVTVAGKGDSTGSFAFRVLDMSATATSLTPGTATTSALSPSNSANLYKFSGTAGSTIFLDNTAFTTTDPGGVSGNWTLVDPFGAVVFSDTMKTDSGRLTLASTGNYTLVVAGDIAATGTASDSFNVRPVADTT